ncbi:MAG: DNA-processing protein DprA [Lachnospiraceae bacterium]|nr:DNA-processing protein DprA [Lachnospiraceae bacterium]
MEIKEAYNWLACMEKVAFETKRAMLDTGVDVREIYESSYNNKIEGFVNDLSVNINKDKLLNELINKENFDNAKEIYSRLEFMGIKTICEKNEDFPEKLKVINDRPFFIYYKGRMPDPQKPSVAIVGARACTEYGKSIAEKAGKVLAGHGVQIISGMALGIDSNAQKGALEKGTSFGVLGCGVDVCYPQANRKLYTDLVNKGGVMSEEWPGRGPLSMNFPKRNRIISGLCDVLLVVEARVKSGSLITVNYALDQGKEIYAVPGRIGDGLSAGTNKLLEDGACVYLRPETLLERLGIDPKEETLGLQGNISLEEDEKIVYSKLSLKKMHFNELLSKTGFEVEQLSEILLAMEFKGIIKQPLAFYYMKV